MMRLLDMTMSFQCDDGYRPPPYDDRIDTTVSLQEDVFAVIGHRNAAGNPFRFVPPDLTEISLARTKRRGRMNKPIQPRNAVVPRRT